MSLSLALGSTVALAAPPEEPASDEAPADTGASDEEKDEAESLSEQAIVKFSAKDYDGAVELFQKAYDTDPQPNYLFNIGRVHEEAGKLEKAVEFYATFVKQPGVDIDSREVALDRLKVLRAILQETEVKEPEKGPEDEEPEDEAPENTSPVPPPDPVDQDAERKGKIMRGAGFGLLGVGAGVLIGGAVVGALAQSDNGKAGDAADPAAGQELLSSSQSKAVTADVLLGVGGALLLTGVVLVALGYRAKAKTERVALAPSFGPHGGGVGVHLRF
ncbi:tetratricopeptide repeat protein [Enhygromyxa salina]|uniref:tetratricopeptide repeat protein n=1 Tax=Enhygromyxa salina TaxID=215803 RepID=UPI000D08B05B|nr:tetratricopeptide repeat protein [Enhygromyxa salina]